jgi:hypothetical protein
LHSFLPAFSSSTTSTDTIKEDEDAHTQYKYIRRAKEQSNKQEKPGVYSVPEA